MKRADFLRISLGPLLLPAAIFRFEKSKIAPWLIPLDVSPVNFPMNGGPIGSIKVFENHPRYSRWLKFDA